MKHLNVLQAPHDCYVVLTSRCNLRCLHCYGSYGEAEPTQGELTGAEWGRVLREMSDLGVFFVNIAGGEPTVHPDFCEIMHHLRQIGLHFILTTNGLCTLQAKEAIRQSSDLLIGLKVSLDGPDADSHARLRVGPGWVGRSRYFERTLDTISYFCEHGVPFTIATCLHSGLVDRMPAFLNLILELRPISWYISTISPSGRAQRFSHIFVSDGCWTKEFWSELASTCQEHGIHVRFIDMPVANMSQDRLPTFECPAATWFCEISADGLVAPCPLARVNIHGKLLEWDSVRTNSLGEIWNGLTFRTFREWRVQGCAGCRQFDRCDRCVAQSVQWFDDPLKPAPYCIERGEVLGLENLGKLRNELHVRLEELSRADAI